MSHSPQGAALRSPGPLLTAALLAAGLLYLYHAWLYGAWINDDAGISFTYARNLAGGHGLALNPGGPRVEGYSNPLWVFLLALPIRAGLFDPVVTPKLLAVILGLATFWLLARISGRLFGWPASPVHALPALLLACSVSWVSWSVSGLENALYLFLLAAGLNLHLGEMQSAGRLPWSALVFFLLAITRPEGLLYGGAALVHRVAAGAFRWPLLKMAPVWLAFFAVPFAGYHAWHFQYFADLLPNTYYAKVERGTDLAWRLSKELYDLDSTGWKYVRGAFADYRLGWVLLPGLGLTLVRHTRRLGGILLAASVAALNIFYAVYVGGDWMEQYRFLGPLITVTCLMAAGAVLSLRLERDPALHDPALAGTPAQGLAPSKGAPGRRFKVRVRSIPLSTERRSRRLLSGLLMGAAAAAAGAVLVPPNLWILNTETTQPSVSFARVERRGLEMARLARQLGLEDASLMDPDLGGTSFSSGLEMVDMGGLADPHIARYGYDPRFFLPYVLEERRPTFVRTHCVWSRDTRLNEAEEFRADYIPLWERPCPLACCDQYLDGEYIRKDVFVVEGQGIPGDRRRNLSRSVVLVSFDLGRDVAAPGETLRLESWWTARKPLPEDLRWTLRLSLNGDPLVSETREFTRGLYPPPLWREGEIIRESQPLFIPGDAPEGRYRLVVAVEGTGIDGSATLGELVVDRARTRREAEELFALHRRAVTGDDPEAALDYLERALELSPGREEWRSGLDTAREALAGRLGARARRKMAEGDPEGALTVALAGLDRVGRRGDLATALEELAAHHHRRARELAERPDAFLHWPEALAAYRVALRCDPADSAALMAIERFRGREYVSRAYGDAVLAAHRAGPEGPPVSPLLERIQDEGFHLETLEIIRGSGPIRARLEGEATLGSLALLHQSALHAGETAEVKRVDAILAGMDLARVNQGGRLLFLGSAVEPVGQGRTRLSFWFRVIGRMTTDYRMFLHGYVKDRSLLPEDRREFEFANFDHSVLPSTSRWRPGSIVRHSWTGRIPPGDYRFLFGFFESGGGQRLMVEGTKTAAVEMGWRTIPGEAAP